jgi:peptidoglycan/LPS O-acetylase OafA/YrhL
MKLRHLDVLRALLMLMVLIGHARMMLWIGWQDWRTLPHDWWETAISVFFSSFRFGHQAVMVFFALSGFFIHLRAAQARGHGKDSTFSARDYLGRRARRILPPYYAVLLFTVALDAIGHHYFPRLYLAQTGDGLLDANFRDAGYTLDSVLPALCAQPNLFGIRFGGNAPLWSIGHEVFYYLLYPLFMLVWQRSRAVAYGLGMGAGVACWFFPFAGWWSGMMAAYPIWLAGAWVAEVLCRWPQTARQKWLPWSYCCVAALAGLTGVHLVPEGSLAVLPLNMLMGAGAIGAFELLPWNLMRWRAARALEWLGIRSYSLYIFHFPVQVLISAWCIQTFGERPLHGWLAAAGALLSLGAGLLGFHFVERRFLPARLQAS